MPWVDRFFYFAPCSMHRPDIIYVRRCILRVQEMAKSYRTTITIPSDLKARMDAIGEEVNWSAVASRAFEARLAEIISKRGAKKMEDVVTRLRASKNKAQDEAKTRGIEAGEERA